MLAKWAHHFFQWARSFFLKKKREFFSEQTHIFPQYLFVFSPPTIIASSSTSYSLSFFNFSLFHERRTIINKKNFSLSVWVLESRKNPSPPSSSSRSQTLTRRHSLTPSPQSHLSVIPTHVLPAANVPPLTVGWEAIDFWEKVKN